MLDYGHTFASDLVLNYTDLRREGRVRAGPVAALRLGRHRLHLGSHACPRLTARCSCTSGCTLAAARHPDQPAVVEADRVVTLRQLHERSLSLAAAFRHHGLEPGDRVGLVMEKSTDAITAMFATLIAGGTYVPIQPDWPRGRIDAVLDDCDARLVVADADSDG